MKLSACLLAILATTSTLTAADWDKYIPDSANNYIPDFVSAKHEDSHIYYGPKTIRDRSLEQVTIYGPARIEHSTVNQCTVRGPLSASHSSFNDVHVDGPAEFDDVTVSKEVFINGPIDATESSFETISIASSDLTLSGCTVTTLRVRKNDSNIRQRVYLEKGTKIESIIFEKKGGRVIMGDSTVVVDHLEGGEFYRKGESKRKPR